MARESPRSEFASHMHAKQFRIAFYFRYIVHRGPAALSNAAGTFQNAARAFSARRCGTPGARAHSL